MSDSVELEIPGSVEKQQVLLSIEPSLQPHLPKLTHNSIYFLNTRRALHFYYLFVCGYVWIYACHMYIVVGELVDIISFLSLHESWVYAQVIELGFTEFYPQIQGQKPRAGSLVVDHFPWMWKIMEAMSVTTHFSDEDPIRGFQPS